MRSSHPRRGHPSRELGDRAQQLWPRRGRGHNTSTDTPLKEDPHQSDPRPAAGSDTADPTDPSHTREPWTVWFPWHAQKRGRRGEEMALLSARGMAVSRITEVTFASADRVRDVIDNFNADGFSSLYPKYKGWRRPSPSPGVCRDQRSAASRGRKRAEKLQRHFKGCDFVTLEVRAARGRLGLGVPGG
jgi:hypothetical protein